MMLRGEDVAASVREWLKEDIKRGPSLKHELGKFFIGVSTGTISLFATLLKFAVEKPLLDKRTLACFVALLLSTIVALGMAAPYVVRIRESLDLYDEYNRIISSTIKLMTWWFILWLVGFGLGVARLFCA
ncbi:MAG: hypothetical protein HZB55_09885 [Deltaproteobacteria bacterium]|nr:hypothetical protein [Deltaproteobacteria bacterium]